jgi:hypothetical protein
VTHNTAPIKQCDLSGLRLEDAVGATNALGGADGKRLT